MRISVCLRHLAVALVWLSSLSSAWALYPEPGNIYYGTVRGEGGVPLGAQDNVRLALQAARTNIVNGQQRIDYVTISETEVITASEGKPNFTLRTSLDGGGANRYTATALRPGESVRAVLIKDGVAFELSGAVPVAGTRGSLYPLELTRPCEDLDEDGLCDEWEIKYFGNLFATDGTFDSDGDGYNDREEFSNGWVPTNPNSPGLPLLKIDGFNPQSITVEWNVVPNIAPVLSWSSAITGPFVAVPPASRSGSNPVTVAVEANKSVFFILVKP